MALYDNKHWLLSHIRDSFISTDDSGACEAVMTKEDIPNQLHARGAKCYPGMADSDDEEDLDTSSECYDINQGSEFGSRKRTKSIDLVDKTEFVPKKATINHIKWEKPVIMTSEEKVKMFGRKNFREKQSTKRSVFADRLESASTSKKNPFALYANYDGRKQIGIQTKSYKIYMYVLSKEERSYPHRCSVVTHATVRQFIGVICYKYAEEHPEHNLKDDIDEYGLYISEDEEGEMDIDFPCLDPRELIVKFEFSALCLRDIRDRDRDKFKSDGTDDNDPVTEFINSKEIEQQVIAENQARMQGHTTAMEAPLYQLYRVYLINKVRTKTEVHVGISGDKIEIDPAFTGKGATRFWHRQKSMCYHMDSIAWCELQEGNKKESQKAHFTLVYAVSSSTPEPITVSSSNSESSSQVATFKTHDFETDSQTAQEIVRKINNILELRSSTARKEYIAHRERKSSRRKSFHLHPRC